MVEPIRERGINGAEKRGYVKSVICQYIIESEKAVSREDVADYILGWSKENTRQPIRQRSGIFKHIKELSDDHKVITCKKEGYGYVYYVDTNLEAFRKLAEFFLNNDMLWMFVTTDYFKKIFSEHFSAMFHESFDIKKLPQKELDVYRSIFEVSPSCFELLMKSNLHLQGNLKRLLSSINFSSNMIKDHFLLNNINPNHFVRKDIFALLISCYIVDSTLNKLRLDTDPDPKVCLISAKRLQKLINT